MTVVSEAKPQRMSSYVLVDPFNHVTSGVTAYTRLAAARISAMGVRTHVIGRREGEGLEAFRRRVASEIVSSSLASGIVEVPETLAAGRYIPNPIRRHIRLHGSRHYGAIIQGQRIKQTEMDWEQQEIDRATIVSSPSVAAVDASKGLFSYPQNVRFYPNPMPDFCGSAQVPDVDVLFLGRWHRLKGIFFYERLAKLLPHRSFGIAASSRPVSRIPRALFFSATTREATRDAISRARVVVVPSLFETASMVGLESISLGRCVVTWKHLGLVEYAEPPALRWAEPWDIENFAEQVEDAIRSRNLADFERCVRRVNGGFDTAVSDLICNIPPGTEYGLLKRAQIDWLTVLSRVQQMDTAEARRHILKRKLRKLWRDPAAFWRDSALRLALGRKSSENAAPKTIESTVKAQVEVGVPVRTTVKEKSNPLMLGSILREGRVTFGDPPLKPAGWVTALVYHIGEESFAKELLGKLDGFDDFSPTRASSVGHICFESVPGESVISILNRIDRKNKERIARISNLLLINAPGNLVAALRSCGPNNRTILLVTEAAPADVEVDVTNTDVLICVETHPASEANGLRRKVLIPSSDELHYAVRKVIQEIGPKRPDMLFPLIGNQFAPELLQFNTNIYQGLIRLKKHSVPECKDFHEFVSKTAAYVEEMLVTESIYMRYRSLCEQVEDGESPARLIEACLMDGVLFDVA